MNETTPNKTTKAVLDPEIIAAAKITKPPGAKSAQKITVDDVEQVIWNLAHQYIESHCKDESALIAIREISTAASTQAAALKAYKDAMEAC